MDDLLRFHGTQSYSLESLLEFCAIKYVGPGDAARTGLPSESIDFHTSFTVFEHIPPDVLVRILKKVIESFAQRACSST